VARKTIDLDWLFTKWPQSVLERTLIGEYLFSKGYLISELKTLPFQVADDLISEAVRFTDLKLVEMDVIDKFSWNKRLPISLN
jgi:hypothetical protein